MNARWVGAASILVWMIGIGGLARAQEATESPERDEARRRMQLGQELYEEGRFAQALTEFEHVHELMQQINPARAGVVLFNVARCYSRLGRDREAIATYERFLAESPDDERTHEPRERAQAELRELRARASLGGGASISAVGPIVIGIGGAAILASAITGGLALSADSAANEGCVAGVCPDTNRASADEARLLANVTDGLLFSGIAIAAAGVVLTLFLPGESGAAPISAACAADGCTVAAHGRF